MNLFVSESSLTRTSPIVIMKKNTSFITALFFGIVFILLLCIKTDRFNKSQKAAGTNIGEISEKNTWMNIYQNDKKIGYSNRVIHTAGTGYAIKDISFMRINMTGMIEETSFQTNGKL